MTTQSPVAANTLPRRSWVEQIMGMPISVLCRGADAAKTAAETATQTFEKGQIGGDLPQVSASADGLTLVEALRELGFAASNKEARRKLDEGAVRIDGAVIRDPQYRIQPADTDVPVSLGSKKHGLVTR